MRTGGLRVLKASALIFVAAGLLVNVHAEDAGTLLEKADRQFELANYKDALEAYQELLDAEPDHSRWRHASQRIITCNLRLRLFDEALEAADGYIKRCKGSPYEARAERLAGNLWLLVPHWGTRAGGMFHRARHKQGMRLESHRHDKVRALEHMERARALYAEYDGDEDALALLPEDERKNWHNERIECIFDLASICSRFSIYENNWRWWYSYWAERDEFIAETAGEDDFDERHSHWQLRRKRPIGLKMGPDGEPIFPVAAADYESAVNDDERILFLLKEARKLDRTEERKYTGLSYYRQAMLARARFGMDRLNSYAGMYYWGGKYPLKEELEDYNPWELDDNEAIVLAGGKIKKVSLPAQWDVLSLLKVVVDDYGDSGLAAEAQYGVGLYHQSRQQYLAALKEYKELRRDFPDSPWSSNAQSQIQRINAPQIRINNAGVQLVGEPPVLQLSYRNVSEVWFSARPIDHEGFMESIRRQKADPYKGVPDLWGLGNWHNCFVNGYHPHNSLQRRAARFVQTEVHRWSDEVNNDGTHRYARVSLQVPLARHSAYLITAYTKQPPPEDGRKTGSDAMQLGDSRAVLVLTDLAFIEKQTDKGTLYYVCDARTGAPVEGAEVSVMHQWSRYARFRRRSIHYKQMYDLKTNQQGMAELQDTANRGGHFHVLVKKGEGRLAWTGMRYWSRYHPSRLRSGTFAYCITDRPVYRPEQTVRFKIWLRRMAEGIVQEPPRRNVRVEVFDPRGNKVYTVSKQTDEFGGMDSEFTLEEEPRLGVYRIQVGGTNYLGGGNFRVEEYKKPEFEVVVEPDTSHTRLGQKVNAVIKAEYYFGGPVTEATVNYKVFREDYTHSYYFPGEWDWLYGAGYGLVWYERPWMPWWGRAICCWSPPSWWWGYYGSTPPNPVRELVKQGEADIGEDGTLKVEIDTSSALKNHPDKDHRYVIEAEVRDASRRVISGQGAVKVTRQAYYVFVQSDRGYYRPGEEMLLRIRCLTPENQPVQTEGVVSVSDLVFGGPDNAQISETELKRWKASTDEQGLLELRLRHEKSGQLKLKFEAPDKWGGTVEGYGLVWVCGRDFDGRLYRFNNLELITDKRTYEPGEVAHVMLNTRHAGSYVLFSDEVDNNHLLSWRLLHLPNRSTVVEVPIKGNHRPNFFVEATTVAGARVHEQHRRICVPPKEGIVKVQVSTDKAEYRPGDKAEVKVEARTLDGEPARTQFALTAFDKSVLYIQPEFTPPIAKFFHGNVRHHRPVMSTNLVEQFSAWGYVHRPFQQLHPYPPGWWGSWSPSIGDWRTVSDDELQGLYGGRGESFEENGAAVRESGRRRAAGVGGTMALSEPEGADAAPPAATAAKAARLPMAPEEKRKAGAAGEKSEEGAQGEFAETEVRSEFADTALWLADLVTDADGTASATVEMPENLTTWKISTWGITKDTRVGQADTSVVTTKNLLVRLQAPRFFMEYDEVVISANVHNYLPDDKWVRVDLAFPEDLFQLVSGPKATTDSKPVPDKVKPGEASLTALDVEVAANGESRVDWRVKVLKEGEAKIKVEALTDVESDAMQMTFPVLVHGMTRQVASTGSMRPDKQQATHTVELVVPEERRPEATRLEVQFAPSLVGAMMDALPYVIYYPYGCTEQTMSRFVPCVLTLKTLQNMGISLENVRRIRGRMEEVRRIEKGENLSIYWMSPIFDEGELDRMVKTGLKRITDMQNSDGGWGWWSSDNSSAYLTSYVLYSLCTAQECDVAVDENMVQRGMRFLKNWEEGELRKERWGPHATHAYTAYVLSMKKIRAAIKPAEGDKRPGGLIERLWAGRDKLGLYGKALLAIAMKNTGDQRASVVLQNIMQYKEENKETEVAWFRTPAHGWWYWWNSDIETNAWILRAIVAVDPKSDTAPRMVKWLLNNRRNGYYWRSTRDTALCVAAMSDFAIATGETSPDYTLTLDFDNGAVVKKVRISKDNFFTYDNRFVLEGVTLEGGKHTLTLSKDGPGALYYNTYLRYFTREVPITKAGLHLKIDRAYFKLEQIPYEVEVEDAEGHRITENRLRYKRVPVNDGDTVQSGDIIQVELRVRSDNDYTYLCFEDMKPAGCEAVNVRSGGKGQEGFWSYMELRDEKVAFFVNSLGQGEHLLRYRLRAEVPGRFHALPSIVYGMYVPELRANSDEHRIKIVDQ